MTQLSFDTIRTGTVAQLKGFLTSPELAPYRGDEKITSKTTKPQLLAMIDTAEQEYHNTQRQAERDSQVTPLEQDTPDELPEWERQLIENGAAIDDLSVVQHGLIEQAQERIESHPMVSVDPGKVMGLHYRGRAMGAKHHALIRAAVLRDSIDLAEVDPFMSRNDFRHTPNSERVQKYARQNSLTLGEYGIAPDSGNMPKLTHRQMRRVRKNMVKHGEGFLFARRESSRDYSLLARTPEGLGIYYRFVK